MNTGALGPIDTAAREINDAHRLARQHAESAVQHAIRCGELLKQKKTRLPHGAFKPWIAANCEFSYSSAKAYMRAAEQKDSALSFSSLREAVAHDKPARPQAARAPQKDSALSFSNTVAIRHNKPVIASMPTPKPVSPVSSAAHTAAPANATAYRMNGTQIWPTFVAGIEDPAQHQVEAENAIAFWMRLNHELMTSAQKDEKSAAHILSQALGVGRTALTPLAAAIFDRCNTAVIHGTAPGDTVLPNTQEIWSRNIHAAKKSASKSAPAPTVEINPRTAMPKAKVLTTKLMVMPHAPVYLDALWAKLKPHLEGLEDQGKKNMATMSPGTVAHLTCLIVKVLDGFAAEHQQDEQDEMRIAARVQAELQIMLDEYNKDAERFRRTIAAYKGPFSRTEYKTLLGILHTDRLPGLDDDLRAKFERMFSLVKSKELELCGDDEPIRASTLPKTVAELMAMKAKRRAAKYDGEASS